MNLTVNSSSGVEGEWSFHISDAGEPPSVAVVALWLFLSACVAALFLVIRPAATQRVRRETGDGSGGHSSGALPQKESVTGAGTYAGFVWRLLSAVWTLALYDVVHRTCCYFHLTPYMLARHRLLPLGASFLRDGVWTEWVNWVRLYFLCGSSLSTAATAPASCVGWQLPLAGVLAYHQYPEYTALNTSRLPSPSEVDQYHKVSLEAFLVTAIVVVQLHSASSLLRHLFFTPSPRPTADIKTREEGNADNDHPLPSDTVSDEGAQGAERKGEGVSSAATGKTARPGFTTSLRQADAPGDDAWVDSPEALAEEEARKEQAKDGELPHDSATGLSASHTTRLIQQCWPSFISAGYAAMYAYVGGLPLLMTMVFPCAIVVTSILAMCVST